MRKTVVISVEGGVVHDVSHIPAGVDIMILDYDVDGVDDDRIIKDRDGKECVMTVHQGGVA